MAKERRTSVLASIWAEDISIGMVLFKIEGKTYQPLADWRSNLAGFNLEFIPVLEQWITDHKLNKIEINQPLNYTGDLKSHPILQLMPKPAKAEMVERIEPIEGLAHFHKHLKKGTIDFSEYSKDRLLEQIKRLHEKRDPIVMAFFQGISKKGSPGLALGSLSRS